MKRNTVTLLPFAPHQQQNSPNRPPQRSSIHSRLPSIIHTSVPCIMSGTSRRPLFDISRRSNPLRTSPSIISKSSCDTTTTSSSTSSSSGSSYSNTSPTSSSTPPPSLPPSPPPPLKPTNRSPGKSRPLPQPPAATRHSLVPNDAVPLGQVRTRSPPPAWSPPETPLITVRPTRPRVMLPSAAPQRQSSHSSDGLLAPNLPRRSLTPIEDPVSSPEQSRVRPLPRRPVPPGPPSEANTPIAPFGLPRWNTDTLTILQDDASSPDDDSRAIDWDLIDEVMKRAA
ncbi:hypothetical protein BC826DRAFT_60506 [Russula brevipes]|nr:hypothetical protein BC826DRAFT_60506 [Russula brevipes]